MKEQLVSVSVIAFFFGRDERSIQILAKEGIIQKESHGKYPLVDSIKKYISYLQNMQNFSGSRSDLDAEKTRLARLQGDKLSLDIKVMEGELIPAEQVEKVWTGYVVAARAAIMALPVKMTPQIMTMNNYSEIESFIKSCLWEAISELAEYKIEDYINFIEVGEKNKKGEIEGETA